IFHDFMNEHGLVSLEQSQNIVVERLKGLNKQLTEVQKTRIELQSRIHSIGQALKSKTSLEDLPEVVDSASMRDLKMEWIRTQQDISDLEKRFGANHPQLLSAQAKLQAIRDKIELDVRSIMSSSHLQYQRAQKQEKDIFAALNKQQREVMTLDRLRVEYKSLRDAHTTLDRTYQTIVQRIDEIEIASAAGTEEDNIFIIEPAKVPVKRAKPKRTQAVLLACIIGSMLGLGLAFFLQYLDTTVKTREDVEQAMKLPVLGFVPALQEELNGEATGERSSYDLIAVDRTRSALAEAFRSLRTSLSFSIDSRGVRSFLVTSPSPLEGKSLVSINLAVTFAQAGKRVLLVDSDLRKPRIHKTFNLPSSAGLSNLLVSKGKGELVGYAQESGIENLYILPSGPRPPNPAELLATDRMGELIKEMEECFDRVIFDTPPVVNVTDASILMHFIGGGIVVIRGFSTQWELAQRASELLQGTQGKMLGAILNNADTPRGAYGYYGYYYYSNYYYYYGDSEDDTNGRGKNKKRRKHSSKGGGKRKSDSAPTEKDSGRIAADISRTRNEQKNMSDSKGISA
ncbi:MAG: polysaccharide biosynthesis tyrosine autokinase, partial [Planctomycetes bacterium]|nr:polysaccharide biosynthesis tyrosine autokinase [Planctomycetota bacterium]